MTVAIRLKQIQPALEFAALHPDADLSLVSLATRVGLSPFHLHRVFSAAAGETPKRFALRLRLGRAAAMLLVDRESVLDVALSCGFQNHESFCRAFRQRFGMTPSAYRQRGFANVVNEAQARDHIRFVNQVSPCVGLYHISQEERTFNKSMTYSIAKKELAPQPVLVVRRSIKRSEIAATIADALPKIAHYAQQNGIALVGLPFTRYVEVGPGLMTIEPGMRIAGPAPAIVSATAEVRKDTLPAGPAATTLHAGPYEHLPEAYGALEQWIQAEGLKSGGAPWECYVNSPGEFPNPKDWKTEVYWPLAH